VERCIGGVNQGEIGRCVGEEGEGRLFLAERENQLNG